MRAALAPDDRDEWIAPALVGLFATLVAAILHVVRGWSAPMLAWLALAGVVIAALALHAGVRAVLHLARLRWRAAAGAALLALGLAGTAGAMLWVGHALRPAHDDTFIDAPMDAPEDAR